MYEGNVVFVYDTSRQGERSAKWLIKWPIAALQRAGYFCSSVSLHDVLKPPRAQKRILEQADIIIYERHVDDPWMGFFKWAAKNKRFMLTLDDAYWEAHPSTKAYQYWSKKDRLQKLEDVAAMAERVIVPSMKLAEHFPNGHYKPNRPDLLDPCWSVSPLFSENAILWGGTEGHIGGMEDHPALEAVDWLVKEELATFIAVPGSPMLKNLIESAVSSVTIMDSFLPHDEWLKVLSGATVSICPLGEGYDEYRSWIKALESAAVGIPWVGSSRGMVYSFCKGGFEIAQPESADWWIRALDLLLQDCDTRNQMCEEGIRWAWKQGLDDHLDEWEEIFNAA